MALCGAPRKTGPPCRRTAGPSGRCPSHPLDDQAAGAVRREFDRALAAVPDDWRTALARTLASSLDVEANASVARELRAVMTAIVAASPANTGGTPLDDLVKRRAARQPSPDGRA